MLNWISRRIFANNGYHAFGYQPAFEGITSSCKVHGVAVLRDDTNGTVSFQCKNEKYLILYKDGSAYVGDAIQGKRHGSGLFYDNVEGSLYFGDWKDNLRHGRGRSVRISRYSDGLLEVSLTTSNLIEPRTGSDLCSHFKRTAFTKYYGVWNEGHLMGCFRHEISGIVRPELVKWQDNYLSGVLAHSDILQVEFASRLENASLEDDAGRPSLGQHEVVPVEAWNEIDTERLALFFNCHDLVHTSEVVTRLSMTGAKLFDSGPITSQTLCKLMGIKSFGERTKILRLLHGVQPSDPFPGNQSHGPNTESRNLPHGRDHGSSGGGGAQHPEHRATRVDQNCNKYHIEPSQLTLTHLLPCSICRDESEVLFLCQEDLQNDVNADAAAASLSLLRKYRECASCSCPRYSFKGTWLGTEVCIRLFPGIITDESAWNNYLDRVLDMRYPNLILVIGVVKFAPFLHGIVTEWMSNGSMEPYLQFETKPKRQPSPYNGWQTSFSPRTREIRRNKGMWQTRTSKSDSKSDGGQKLTRSEYSGFLTPVNLPTSANEKAPENDDNTVHRISSIVPMLIKLGLIKPEPYGIKNVTSFSTSSISHVCNSELVRLQDQMATIRGFYVLPQSDRPARCNNVIRECLHHQNLVDFLTNIALTLMYLHQRGIPHGSLKASNILIGERLTPKIDDFGYRSMLRSCFSAFPFLKTPLSLHGSQREFLMYGKCCDCKSTFLINHGADCKLETPLMFPGLSREDAVLASPEFTRHLVSIANNISANIGDDHHAEVDWHLQDVHAFGVLLWQFTSGLARPFAKEAWLNFSGTVLGIAGGGLLLPELSCHQGINTLIKACTKQYPSDRPTFPTICRGMRLISDQMRNEAADMLRSFFLGVDELPVPIKLPNSRIKHCSRTSSAVITNEYGNRSLQGGFSTDVNPQAEYRIDSMKSHESHPCHKDFNDSKHVGSSVIEVLKMNPSCAPEHRWSWGWYKTQLQSAGDYCDDVSSGGRWDTDYSRSNRLRANASRSSLLAGACQPGLCMSGVPFDDSIRPPVKAQEQHIMAARTNAVNASIESYAPAPWSMLDIGRDASDTHGL